jgi:excisionase family DNA binding protein
LHTDGGLCDNQLSKNTGGVISMKKAEAELTPEIMTVSSIADYLQLHPTTIYWLLKNGQIPALKLGYDWHFSKADVDRWAVWQS